MNMEDGEGSEFRDFDNFLIEISKALVLKKKKDWIKVLNRFVSVIMNNGNVEILKHIEKNTNGINIHQISKDLDRPYNNIYKNIKLLVEFKLVTEKRNIKEQNELLILISKFGKKVIKLSNNNVI